MHKPAPVASCVMYFLVGRDGNWRVTHRRTARACWVRHIDIFFLVCTQISGWNVIWLNSCSLHHYESRFAGNVRKAHLSIFWKVPQGFLFRTACVAHWPAQIQNMFPKKVPYFFPPRSDVPRNYTVQIFCPMCHDIFTPRSSRSASIDGAYFGTTFPHLFMLTFPECIPKKNSQYFVPRVFGFRIHKSSPYYADSALSSSQVKRRQKPLRRAKSKPIVLWVLVSL